MPSVINSDNGVISGTSGLKTSGSNDGLLDFQSNGTRIAGITTSAFQVGTDNISAVNSMGFRNRIINGDMRIDQRNAGAPVTTSSSFPVDRFTEAFGNASCSFQQVLDAPSGFINSLKLTVTTGAAPSAATNNVIIQKIEGLNVSDFGLGNASATAFTLSFWVKGSITGTYAVAFTNSAFNRSYVATYTIGVANTWEYKTVTVSGDTTGTWLTTNGIGLTVLWDFGSGTDLNTTAGSWQAGNFYRTSACTTIASTTNATLQITGVQLEAGSVATPFERRDYGRELIMCQRYYELQAAQQYISYNIGNVGVILSGQWSVTKRSTPTVSVSSAQIAASNINSAIAIGTVAWNLGFTGTGGTGVTCAGTIVGSIEL